jgi:hypothetical protein
MPKIERLLEFLLSGVLATLIALVITSASERRQEERLNSQNYILAFYGSGFMEHRDTLLGFAYEPDVGSEVAVERSKADYAKWLINELDSRSEIRVSVSALAEFIGAARQCLENDSCESRSLRAAIGPYSASFYDVFAPVLIEMRCNSTKPHGSPPAVDPEDDVLFFAQVDPAQITCSDIDHARKNSASVDLEQPRQ